MSNQTMKFSTLMRYEDFIVRDHRVYDIRIMPGVTFLEMIFRLLKSKGFATEEIELRNVLFKEPVVTTPEYDKKIRLTFEQQSPDHWAVVAQSQEIKDGQPLTDQWADNLQCELQVGIRHPAHNIDAARLISSSVHTEDMDHTYGYLRRSGIDHYEFMKLLGRVHVGRDFRLAELQLGDLAQQYAEHFSLHPAFLDGSSCVPGIYMLSKAEAGEKVRPFIPIFIESFRMTGRLNNTCFVLVRDDSKVDPGSQDIFYSDIELYDEAGRQVAVYTRFGFKKVRSADLIMNLQKLGAVQATVPAQVAATGGADSIQDDLRQMVAGLLNLPAEQISLDAGFYDQGLDSRQLLDLVKELERKLQTKLYPTLLFEYTNIRRLADFLEREYGGKYHSTLRGPVTAPAADAQSGQSRQALIQADLRAMVADLQDCAPERVSLGAGFYDQGLDSRSLLDLVKRLEAKLGRKLYPTLLFEYTNILKLSEYLETQFGSTYPLKSEHPVVEHERLPQAGPELQTPAVPASATQGHAADFYYRPTWVQRPLGKGRPERSTGKRTVLILHPEQSFGFAEALADAHSADEVLTIQLDEHTRSAEELEQRLPRLARLDLVYFLGGLVPADTKLGDLTALEISQEQGVLALFRLIKALSERQLMRQLKELKVVTANVHQVFSDEKTLPYGGSLFGLAKTLAKEYPRTSVSCMDFDLGPVGSRPTTEAVQASVQALLSEPGQPNGQEVAIRKGIRYVQAIQALQLPPAEQALLRRNGVYVILGGAGGIGLEFTRHLVAKHQARVALIGRRELNESQRSRIAAIEALGGQVMYLQADATRETEMQAAIARVKTEFGPINGVVHSAIVLRDKTLETMDEETFRAALAPKVTGTVVLHRVLQGEALDFMLFFSSVQSFLGNVGQSNYAAACTFKDAYAKAIGQTVPYPVKIINWGFWGTVGVVATEDYNKQLAAIGAHSIDPSEGMAAIDQVLGLPVSQVIPFKADAGMQATLNVDQELTAELYPTAIPSVLAALKERLPAAINKQTMLDLKARDQAQSAFRRFGRCLALEAFQSMGAFRHSGERYTRAELARHIGIVPAYDRLLDSLIMLLAAEGFLVREGDQVACTNLVEEAGLVAELSRLADIKQELVERFSDLRAYVQLVWTCVKSYPEVLTGRKNHMAVMFPKGSMELVEGIYHGNEVSDYFNEVVANVVRTYVEERLSRDPQAKIRILEIGAGTGGTSSVVLRAVKPYGDHLHYFYTDLALEFTKHQDPEYRQAYPFVEFRALNIENDPLTQGFAANSIDLVFGTNVLHATRRIAESLAQAKKLLKTNGLMVINEVTQLQDFTTLTFGLTSGWWLYEDAEQRIPGSPLLAPPTWQALLEQNGMTGFTVYSLLGKSAQQSEQNVMVTQGDGYAVSPRAEASHMPAPAMPATGPLHTAQPAVPSAGDQDIAIIGISGRYPQAQNLEEFWANLKAGRDCVTEIPHERWDLDGFYTPDKEEAGKSYSKWGGFLADIDKFDPLFFNISPREAELMDPQERLFLEASWEALEDAGYSKGLKKVGVFVGAMWGQYQMLVAQRNGRSIVPASIYASIANRVSYFFDFSGPSFALDTMCSSALTAIHLACESLRRGECEAAIAGGVNVSVHPNKYLYLSQQKFVSSDGRCRAFGEGGDGFVPGEGVGAVLLKPLGRAIADGDRIDAVIKGSALNHGGYASGFTVPNPHAQAEVIAAAIKQSGVNPRTISYIETHGTGTSLGDPIELSGLSKAYAEHTKDKQFVAIGSVKTNIGHLESAAGIAGLTKVLLQMRHNQLVPSLHANQLNPNIDFENSPFFVQRELTGWNKPVITENGQTVTAPRRAAISAFGAGGSNAHLIIEQYEPPVTANGAGSHTPQVIVLAARNRERLRQYAARMADYLQAHGSESTFESVAYTLQVGREAMEERLAIVAETMDQACARLRAYSQGETDLPGVEQGNVRNGKQESEFWNEGEGPKALLAAMAAEGKLQQLARLFVCGVAVDWRLLHSEGIPVRVPLPTYPFARRRYWVDSYPGTAIQSESAAPGKRSGSVELQRPAAQPLPEPQQGPNRSRQTKVLEIFEAADYMGQEVGLEILDGAIALITMNDRANRNMFSDNLVHGLMARFKHIQQAPEIKAVVVTGYDNVFSMGGTQDQLMRIADQKSSFTDLPFLYRGLLECDVPVISAVQGHASGGGLLFGLYADIILMSEESVYSAVFTKYGFTPGMGATLILKEKLGHNLAMEMMFTAKSYTGEELHQRGSSILFRKRQDVLPEALAIARMLAEKPRHTLMTLKQEMAGRILEQMPAVLECEQKMHAETVVDPEVKARIERFYLSSPAHTGATTMLAEAKPRLKLNEAAAFDEQYFSQLLADLEAGKVDPAEAMIRKNERFNP